MNSKAWFTTNDVKIYDIMAHRSFWVNRGDINVKATITQYRKFGKNGDKWLVYVHPKAVKKTPNHVGCFQVGASTFDKITTKPRREW